MNDQAFFTQRIQEPVFTGPLGAYMDKFVSVLLRQGYARCSVSKKIQIISKLSKWLQEKQLLVKELDEACVKRFICSQETKNTLRRGDRATLKQFIQLLREECVLAAPAPKPCDSLIEIIKNSFSKYLKQERGLSQSTLDNYLPNVELFLIERFGKKNIVLDKLRSQDISRFILRHAHENSVGRAQLMTTSLRSFFSFLYQHGQIATNLSEAVPTVAKWRFSTIPKFLLPEQVNRILEACDKKTHIGQRNYAILLLLARLGLRAGEIVNMQLEDINWENAEILVRGKSSQEQKLPLPEDVGQAIATYLRYSRPCCSSRKVFIRMLAPRQGFYSSSAVCCIVERTIADAGLDLDFKGAHLFRHTLATDMLKGGASISAISQILRHQLPNTTEIYAKVDLEGLRAIALPWPREVICD